MSSIGSKYVILTGALLFLFVNFIACGSHFYKVNLREDIHDDLPESALDPSSALYGIHAANGWYEIPISFRIGEKFDHLQKDALLKAIGSWEKVVGKKLFHFEGVHKGVSGDSFKDLYSSLEDGINGHYIDSNWRKTHKPTVVLATTIWDNLGSGAIGRADIRFNAENYIIGDSLALASQGNKEVVDMQSLAAHEIGHLLGLAHVNNNINPYSIMNPTLFIGEGLTSRKLSRGDIVRIQTIYGCEDRACDIDALVEDIELVQSDNPL